MISSQLNHRLKVMAAGIVAVGLASVGLGACSPASKPLACTTITTVGKNLAGTVTTKTAPGAKVLTVANFRTARVQSFKTADAKGVTTSAFDLRKATTTNRVDVAVLATKGNASGVCSAKFVKTSGTTENSQPGTSKGLRTVPTVKWLNTPAKGQTLPFDPDLPSNSCFDFMTGLYENCGTVAVNSLIKGFSGYGGTPKCPPMAASRCDPANQAFIDGADSTVTLSWQLTCTSTGDVTKNSAVVNLRSARHSSLAYVSPQTAATPDSARLEVVADLPLGADIALCDAPSTLDSLQATSIKQHLNHANSSYPDWRFVANGPYVY